MALSKREKEERLQVIHIFDSILGRSDSGSSNINEDVGNKYVDLKLVQTLLEGKSLPYTGVKSLRGDDSRDRNRNETITLDIMFMSNKHKNITGNNCLTMSFDGGSESNKTSSRADDIFKVDPTLFAGVPNENPGADFKSTFDIVNLCNSEQIFNTYVKSAVADMRRVFPTAYYMYEGNNIVKFRDKTPGTTLGVRYNPMRRKYEFMYNTDFILAAALDEWCTRGDEYKSLQDCYIYTLTFLISHEMMHIIRYNTNSSVNNNDVGGHEYVNVVNDSFINCSLSRMFRSSSRLRYSSRSNAPMLNGGIGSSIYVRSEHNVGFKHFENTTELLELISGIIDKANGSTLESGNGSMYDYGQDLTVFEDADVYIKLDISPNFTSFRSTSNAFQNVANTILSSLTKGKYYFGTERLTDEELASDKEVLPNGTLVRIQQTSVIGIVSGYDESSSLYAINDTKTEGVNEAKSAEGIVKTPIIKDAGNLRGNYSRANIVPVDISDLSWLETPNKEKKEKLSPEDLADNAMEPPEDMQQMQEEGADIKAINVGDVVWVRRKRVFGTVKSVENGKFEVSFTIEKECKVIDESPDGQTRLIERVFEDTGRVVGNFTAKELDPVENPTVDKKNKSDQSSSSGSSNGAPPPSIDDEDEQGNSSGSKSGDGSDDGENGENSEYEFDRGEDRDIDDKADPTFGDSEDGSGGGGGSVADDQKGDAETDNPDMASSSTESENGTESGSGQDSDGDSDGDSGQGTDGSDGEGAEGEDTEGNGSSSAGSGENPLGGESEQGEGEGTENSDGSAGSQDSSNTTPNSNGGQSEDSQNGSDGDSSSGSGTRAEDFANMLSGDGDEESQPKSGKNKNSAISDPNYDFSNDYDEDDSVSQEDDIKSAIEKLQEAVDKAQTESSKQRQEAERKEIQEQEEKKEKSVNKSLTSENGPSPEEIKAAKEMLSNSARQAQEERERRSENEKSSSSSYDSDDLENAILSALGAASLTNLIKPTNKSKWKQTLEDLLDRALGFNIQMNPNLINKKIEDAPPGREDEVTEIKKVAILLDCSGSMGYEKFKQVIAHLDTMIKVKNMNRVEFHIIAWAAQDVKELLRDRYVKCKGRKLKATISRFGGNGWTLLAPALVAASQKIKKPDAILILTDADLGDSPGSTEFEIARKYIKKNREKVIWVLTKQHNMSGVTMYDPRAKAEKRVIKFQG